jgi:hypothetical protein
VNHYTKNHYNRFQAAFDEALEAALERDPEAKPLPIRTTIASKSLAAETVVFRKLMTAEIEAKYKTNVNDWEILTSEGSGRIGETGDIQRYVFVMVIRMCITLMIC